jgi:long-chain fatty acid transport protein
MRDSSRGVVCTLALLLLSRTGVASPLLELVGGMDGEGGLQGRALPGGSSSAYFNPALLTDSPAGFTIGFVVVSEQIGVSLDGRPGPSFSVPEGVEHASHADGSPWRSYPLPTGVLQNGRAADPLRPALPPRPRQGAGSGHQTITYEMVGLVSKLFQKRLSLGFFALVPNGDFTTLRAPYVDEREQYFTNSLHPELYSDRLTAISLALGAAVALSDQVSLGASATIGLRAGVGAPVYVVDAGRLQDLLLTLDTKVNVSVSPHFGVSYRPNDRWRLTGTVHTPQKVELDATFTFLLATGVSQSSGVSFVLDYVPWQFGAGAAYDVVKSDKDTVTLAGSAVYGRWSDYVDRHGDRPLAAYPWQDTLTGAGGVRYAHGPVGTFLDVQYKPTPVPMQTGRSNYVDNDRLGAAVGADYTFPVLHTPMHLGAQLQTHYLLPRHQWKLKPPNASDGRVHTPALVRDEVPDDAVVIDEPLAGRSGLQTNNPGFPGFGSSGLIVGGGVYMSIDM